MSETMLWYDLETLGLNPGWDRVVQFASIRTDQELKPIEKPVVLYCRVSPEVIPDPQACLVTGITPSSTFEKGLSEYEFTKAILDEMSRPETCVVGYNSIRFDDEFIRNLFYRNLMDPFAREWQNGNSRWDILDMVRMAHDLRPEGIQWPSDERGVPSFKLSDLAQANKIEQTHAHDASSDVGATLGLARLVRSKQPRLYNFLYERRGKQMVDFLLSKEEAVVHSSGMFTSEKGCTTVVLPLTKDPENPNRVLSFDLREDPRELLELPVEAIKERIFTKKTESERESRIPIKGIHINKSPAVAPLSTMREEDAQRLGISLSQVQRRTQTLLASGHLREKLCQVFEGKRVARTEDDVDLKIYSGGFFSRKDQRYFQTLHHFSPEELVELEPSCQDKRVPELFFRFLGRNFYSFLPPEKQASWRAFCRKRLLGEVPSGSLSWEGFDRELRRLQDSLQSSREKAILESLQEYQKKIEKEILSSSSSPTKGESLWR